MKKKKKTCVRWRIPLKKKCWQASSARYSYITMYKMVFFSGIQHFSRAGHGFFHALSAPEHAGGPPVHDGASVGPGQAPWRVLWVFKVAKFGKPPWRRSTDLEPSKTMENPHISCFGPPSHAKTLALSFPRFAATDTIMLACVDHNYASVDIACARCAVRVSECACARVCAFVCKKPTISAF